MSEEKVTPDHPKYQIGDQLFIMDERDRREFEGYNERKHIALNLLAEAMKANVKVQHEYVQEGKALWEKFNKKYKIPKDELMKLGLSVAVDYETGKCYVVIDPGTKK